MSDARDQMAQTQDVALVRQHRQAVAMQSTGAGAQLGVQTLADMVTFAQVMAQGKFALPKHLRGEPSVCLAVTMQALRWEMDPWAVASKTYYVNDRLAYEAQLVAAVVNTRAPIAKSPQYEYSGDGPTRRCKISVLMSDGSTQVYETPLFRDIPIKNSPLWKADPDQQLGYYAIRSWARRHTPEVIMGVYTPEEVRTFRSAPRGPALALDSGFTPLTPKQADAAGDGAIDVDTFTPEEEAAASELAAQEAAATDNKDPPAPSEDNVIQSSGAIPSFDVISWAADFQVAIPDYTDVDKLAADWAEHREALRGVNANAVLQINRMVAERAKLIAMHHTGR